MDSPNHDSPNYSNVIRLTITPRLKTLLENLGDRSLTSEEISSYLDVDSTVLSALQEAGPFADDVITILCSFSSKRGISWLTQILYYFDDFFPKFDILKDPEREIQQRKLIDITKIRIAFLFLRIRIGSERTIECFRRIFLRKLLLHIGCLDIALHPSIQLTLNNKERSRIKRGARIMRKLSGGRTPDPDGIQKFVRQNLERASEDRKAEYPIMHPAFHEKFDRANESSASCFVDDIKHKDEVMREWFRSARDRATLTQAVDVVLNLENFSFLRNETNQ